MAEVHRRLTGRLAAVLASLRDIEPVTARLCEAGRRMLDADGAALAIMVSPQAVMTVAATDRLASELEELQDVLGEGPGRLALIEGAPQLADLGGTDDVRWPLMHEQGRVLGFDGTVLAVPLKPSTTVIGTLTVHRSARAAPPAHVEPTAMFLSVALGTAVLLDPALERQEDAYAEAWTSRAQIHQATGMVISQVGVRPEDALALMRGQAFAIGASLTDVADSVIERRLNFRDFTIEGD